MTTAAASLKRDTPLTLELEPDPVQSTPTSSTSLQRVVSPRIVLVAVGFVLLTMAVAIWETYETDEANNWVRHTQTVQTELANLAFTLRDAEVEHFNYILSGEQDHLAAFENDLEQLRGSVARLKTLYPDDSGQRDKLETASALIAQRIEHFQRDMELRDRAGTQAALNEASLELHTVTADQLRDLFIAMRDEVRQDTAEGLELAETTQLFSVSALIFSLGGLTLIGWLMMRQANAMIVLRRQAEVSLRQSNRELETEVARRTADLRTSNQRLVRAQRDARVGAWEWDSATDTLSASEEMLRLLELKATDGASFTWQSLLRCIHPEDHSVVNDAVTDLRHNEIPCDIDFRLRRVAHGDEFANLKAVTEPSGGGDHHVMRGTLQIITERKKMELSLRQSNEELSQFAYVASHDLQEPLRMVGSYLELLNMRYGEQLEGDGKEFIGYAIDGAGRMKTLINDLLAFSRVSNQTLEKSPVPMDDILQDVLKVLNVKIQENDAVIECDTSLPIVPGDKGQLTQLLQNLIDNGIKYRGEATPVITISTQKSNDRWIFSVTDNGIGIAEEHRQKVFEIFKRLHSRDKYSGTGIGLAVCERIVHHHGGRIWVDRSESGGSVFKFSMPTLETSHYVATESGAAGEHPAGGR